MPKARVWGLREVGLAGIPIALTAVVIAGALALFGDTLGLPGIPLAVVVFVLGVVNAVFQVTRLTFTDTSLIQDSWTVGVRRRHTLDWNEIEALWLDNDPNNETATYWRVHTRSGSRRLMLTGDIRRRRHTALLAGFHRHHIPIVDHDGGAERRPIDEHFLWRNP